MGFSLQRQLCFLVMRGCNVCRWCYFSSHFTLRLKGSAAIVTLARVAWHILKWRPALSLGVLALGFPPSSRSSSLCYSLHTVHLLPSSLCLLWSYLSCPLRFSLHLFPAPPPYSYPLSSCHLPFSAPISLRTPMFSLCPDNNCK